MYIWKCILGIAENQGSEIVSFKEFGLNLDFFPDLFLMQYIQLMQKKKKCIYLFSSLFCIYFPKWLICCVYTVSL